MAMVTQLSASSPLASSAVVRSDFRGNSRICGAERRRTVMTMRLYRITEVAELMGCGRTTVYALLKSGELKSVKVAGCRRVHADDLAEYVDRLRRGV